MYKKVHLKIGDFADIADWWDNLCKPTIREFCMDVSERLSYVKKNTKQFLFSYLSLVTRRGNWREVARVRKQLRGLLERESMGFVVRSRFKENLESETASLFYLN